MTASVKPFVEHLNELQRRLMYIAVVALIFGVAAYAVNGTLISALQKPLGQKLYFTSPIGGFNFVFKICASVGLVGAVPVILYNVLKFIDPVIERSHRHLIIKYAFWSTGLALAGVLFAYFVSLPSALHFLTNFGGKDIQSLISVDEYFSFALAYVAGFAVLFQLPLIILFINRIKPLTPRKMMGVQRFIILGSYIVAAILTPTPDPVNQTIMAIPMILLFQVSIILVWMVNRRRDAAVFEPEYEAQHEPNAAVEPQFEAAIEQIVAPPAIAKKPRLMHDVVPPKVQPKTPAAAPPRSRPVAHAQRSFHDVTPRRAQFTTLPSARQLTS